MEMDNGVGTIINKLEELNIDSNTLVFFTSDNGAWIAQGLSGGDFYFLFFIFYFLFLEIIFMFYFLFFLSILYLFYFLYVFLFIINRKLLLMFLAF